MVGEYNCDWDLLDDSCHDRKLFCESLDVGSGDEVDAAWSHSPESGWPLGETARSQTKNITGEGSSFLDKV